jgi:hypothetical protein
MLNPEWYLIDTLTSAALQASTEDYSGRRGVLHERAMGTGGLAANTLQ